MISSQWDYATGSSTHLYKAIPLVGDGTSSYNVFQLSFAGEYVGGSALQWAVEIMDSSGNTRLYTTGSQYYDVNQVLVVGLPTVTPVEYSQHTDIVYRCHIWVKKKNGGNIDRTDMYASNFTWYFNRSAEVVENTLPAEWFGTSTVTGVNPLQTMTTVASTYYIDDSVVSSALEIPPITESAIGQLMSIFSRILTLPYLKFMICFAVVVGLVAWFLH